MTSGRERLDLGQLVTRLHEELRPVAEREHVALWVSAPPELHVWAERFSLEQALGHLLIDAIERSPARTEVSMVCRPRAGEVALEVADSDPGGATEGLSRPDELLGDECVGTVRGRRPGLMLAEKVIERHGGRLELEDHEDGSMTRVRLPVDPRSAGLSDGVAWRPVEGSRADHRRPGRQERGRVDLGLLADELETELRPVAEQAGVRLHVDAELGLGVWGEPASLSRAVGALARDAIERLPAGAELALGVHRSKGEAVISGACGASGPGAMWGSRPWEAPRPGEDRTAPNATQIARDVVARHRGVVEVAETTSPHPAFRIRLPIDARDRARHTAPAMLLGLVLVLGLGALLGGWPLGPPAPSLDAPKAVERAPVESASGSLAALVARVEADMPTRGSGGYDRPSDSEADRLGDAFAAIREGDAGHAAGLAEPLGYEVVRYRDSDTGRRLLLLRERADGEGRGWGLFAYDPGARTNVAVEVAHPFADLHTEDVGLEIWRATGARAFLLAGAHRSAERSGAADVAHRADSPFEAVHAAALSAASSVVQPHGFDETDRFPEGDADFVVSSGAASQGSVGSLARALRARGLVGCDFDADPCARLGGTTNVQSESTQGAGKRFVHLEMSRRVREDDSLRARVVDALAETVR